MSPSIQFRGQPFDVENATGTVLGAKLADPGITSVTIVAAWVRFGGLGRLKDEIEAFRNRGGSLRVILGIDEGVATRPGLLLTLTLADEVFVFHDRSGRTFHPKVYLCEGSSKASILIGSSNVTAGGLFTNYEASLEASFDLPAEQDADALVAAKRWVEFLLEDHELCLRLDRDLIDSLCENTRYAIAGGERGRRRAGRTSADPELFGASTRDKLSAPGLPDGARAEREAFEGAPLPNGSASDLVAAARTVLLSWSKVLSRSDAQHPTNPSTNPLGNVRLTKGNSSFNWRVWFREELFAEEAWRERTDSRGNQIEVAVVPFSVIIDGEEVGVVDLEVDHAPHRESEQNNHATILHWGPLAPTIRATDYTDYLLTLEKLSDGSYRLDISP